MRRPPAALEEASFSALSNSDAERTLRAISRQRSSPSRASLFTVEGVPPLKSILSSRTDATVTFVWVLPKSSSTAILSFGIDLFDRGDDLVHVVVTVYAEGLKFFGDVDGE
ncbi:hypothetical protein SDC9_131431 [bioreactor metagenome]|uniref:Uncharacterized protein n=1 Tax=bioreactor metagenome TaxID=1076179 RepID=A0A645D4E6_9ZZZZ